jgi:hypothetical protein
LSDVCATGSTMIDLLPGHQRLVNPFTGDRTEPVDGAANGPGESGYEPVSGGDSGVGFIAPDGGWGGSVESSNGEPDGVVGYVITGFGRRAEVFRYSNARG